MIFLSERNYRQNTLLSISVQWPHRNESSIEDIRTRRVKDRWRESLPLQHSWITRILVLFPLSYNMFSVWGSLPPPHELLGVNNLFTYSIYIEPYVPPQLSLSYQWRLWSGKIAVNWLLRCGCIPHTPFCKCVNSCLMSTYLSLAL